MDVLFSMEGQQTLGVGNEYSEIFQSFLDDIQIILTLGDRNLGTLLPVQVWIRCSLLYFWGWGWISVLLWGQQWFSFLLDGILPVRHQPRGYSHLPGVPRLGHSHLPAVPCCSEPEHLHAPAPLCVSLPGQVSLPHGCRQDGQPGQWPLDCDPVQLHHLPMFLSPSLSSALPRATSWFSFCWCDKNHNQKQLEQDRVYSSLYFDVTV